MKDNLSTHSKMNGDPPIEIEDNHTPVLQLDLDKYRGYLNDFDMSIEQQNELLETLFHIMRTFVELGWDLDNIQLFHNEEDQDSGIEPINPLSIEDSSKTFNQVANQDTAKEDLSNE